MNLSKFRYLSVVTLAAMICVAAAQGEEKKAEDSYADVAKKVNKKLVKLFGAGGLAKLHSYGTGVVVSKDGYVLTVASHILDTQDLRVHTADGLRLRAKVVVVAPELDAALLKIEEAKDLDYFDVEEAAKAPAAKNGDWILGFSNQFQIATRDEPMSVQRGNVAAYATLTGRRGVHEFPYKGKVYVIDAITNNPGAGGGVITTTKGELLGIIGKEIRNTMTETWINYAVPIHELTELVRKKAEYKPTVVVKRGTGGYHGIILVPDIVDRTPPFIDDIIPDSPAAKAGLKVDDLLVYIDGEQCTSVKNFKDIMSRAVPETEVVFEVRRLDKTTKGDKLLTIKLKLDKPLVKAP